MTESHEPYITGRKKVISVKIKIPHDHMDYFDSPTYGRSIMELLQRHGYTVDSIEVTYEEEKT